MLDKSTLNNWLQAGWRYQDRPKGYKIRPGLIFLHYFKIVLCIEYEFNRLVKSVTHNL